MTSTARPLVLLGAVSSALLAWLLWPRADPPAAPTPPGENRAAAADAAAATAEPGRQAAKATVPAGSTERAAVAGVEPDPAPPMRRGRVLDCRGLPLASVPIGLAPYDDADRHVRLPTTSPTVPSDARGEFALPAPTQPAAPATGPGWFTLRTTPCRPDAEADLLVVAAPAVPLAGHVGGSDGVGLPEVRVQVAHFFLTEFPMPLEQALVPTIDAAVTDARGDYALPAVPIAAGVDLVFARQGYTTRRLPTLQAASGRLDVVLQTEAGKPGRIRGRVRDAAGPVAGARLLLGFDQETTSDASGEFALEFPARPSRLLATRRGWQPVVREGIGQGTPELDVEFTARALTIGGHVRHDDGTPAAAWRIDLVDPLRGSGWKPVEAQCSDRDPVADALAITDPEGRFELAGLADRSYRLLAYEPSTLRSVQSEPIAAGTTGIVLAVPADLLFDELRGVVFDRAGAPVAGASLSAWFAPASVSSVLMGPSAATDAAGRFVLKNVPRRAVQLGVTADGFEYAVGPIEAWLAERELRVVLLRTCHVQIEGEAELAVTFFDGDGRRVDVSGRSHGASFGGTGWTLRGGKSPVLAVPETAATMVWSRGGKEVGRKPVCLDRAPGAVTLLIAAQ
ncbi:MAG: carboxypeptidase regulatory-like domain-containing protein [Planctomycetes bacterium]|nr:carboxypeptidase regulatory-like domain-containing protein [Planctomycetota bacterium]